LIRDRLHWLPVAQRIRFKLYLMMYKAMHGLAPAYLSEFCAISCVEGRTRSSARGDLVVQRSRTKLGGRAFLSSQVRRHGTGCRAPIATLRPWTVSRRLLRHFCLLPMFNCTFHIILMLLYALYGYGICMCVWYSLESVTVLWRPSNYRDIIIIIIIIIIIVIC